MTDLVPQFDQAGLVDLAGVVCEVFDQSLKHFVVGFGFLLRFRRVAEGSLSRVNSRVYPFGLAGLAVEAGDTLVLRPGQVIPLLFQLLVELVDAVLQCPVEAMHLLLEGGQLLFGVQGNPVEYAVHFLVHLRPGPVQHTLALLTYSFLHSVVLHILVTKLLQHCLLLLHAGGSLTDHLCQTVLFITYSTKLPWVWARRWS